MSGWRHAISWFPGHVAKAAQQIKSLLKSADIVLEVRDARAPRTSGSSQLESLIRGTNSKTQRFLVINKAELVSAEQREQIKEWMSEDHPAVPLFFTSAMTEAGDTKGVGSLLTEAIEKVREKTPRLFAPRIPESFTGLRSKTANAISAAAAEAAGALTEAESSLPLIVMVVGVPNVGKSSLINAFRRISVKEAEYRSQKDIRLWGGSSRRSRKPAKTGRLPGVTTSLTGFQVCWRPSVWMLDTPGVLAPRVDGGWEAALRLAILDLIKYDSASTESIGAYALLHLATTDITQLDRWPTVAAVAARAPELLEAAPPLTAITGAGIDPFASDNDRKRGDRDAARDSAACRHERFALRLLAHAADDMKIKTLTSRVAGGAAAGTVPNLASAADRILMMVRRGQLGRLFVDETPPQLDMMRRKERGLKPANPRSRRQIRLEEKGTGPRVRTLKNGERRRIV